MMKREHFRWLAGLIAAHPNRKVVGRTRLQKTVKLLQHKGFPTDYSYSIHFYGPYSEGVNSAVKLLDQVELVKEELREGTNPYYIYTATESAILPEIDPYKYDIDLIAKTEDVPLELAATYDAFREMGCDHREALEMLQRKKGRKCADGNQEKALDLLRQLNLPVD